MRINGTVWSARDIAARIDHTVLAPDATRKDMKTPVSSHGRMVLRLCSRTRTGRRW